MLDKILNYAKAILIGAYYGTIDFYFRSGIMKLVNDEDRYSRKGIISDCFDLEPAAIAKVIGMVIGASAISFYLGFAVLIPVALLLVAAITTLTAVIALNDDDDDELENMIAFITFAVLIGISFLVSLYLAGPLAVLFTTLQSVLFVLSLPAISAISQTVVDFVSNLLADEGDIIRYTALSRAVGKGMCATNDSLIESELEVIKSESLDRTDLQDSYDLYDQNKKRCDAATLYDLDFETSRGLFTRYMPASVGSSERQEDTDTKPISVAQTVCQFLNGCR